MRQRIEARIAKRSDAFLTREFLDLGGERQVLHAARSDGRGEAYPSRLWCLCPRRHLTDHEATHPGRRFGAVSRQVLDKLKVGWEPTTAERAYSDGRITQVRMTPRVRLRPGNRFSRKLRYRTIELEFER